MLGINHRVLQRGEVLQNNSGGREILAGNDNLFRSVLPVNTKNCFLGADSNAVENMTANILCNTALLEWLESLILDGAAGNFSMYCSP